MTPNRIRTLTKLISLVYLLTCSGQVSSNMSVLVITETFSIIELLRTHFFCSRYETYLSTHSTRALLSQEEFSSLSEQIESNQRANEVGVFDLPFSYEY